MFSQWLQRKKLRFTCDFICFVKEQLHESETRLYDEYRLIIEQVILV